jgi:hypothetical protein
MTECWKFLPQVSADRDADLHQSCKSSAKFFVRVFFQDADKATAVGNQACLSWPAWPSWMILSPATAHACFRDLLKKSWKLLLTPLFIWDKFCANSLSTRFLCLTTAKGQPLAGLWRAWHFWLIRGDFCLVLHDVLGTSQLKICRGKKGLLLKPAIGLR